MTSVLFALSIMGQSQDGSHIHHIKTRFENQIEQQNLVSVDLGFHHYLLLLEFFSNKNWHKVSTQINSVSFM